MFDFLYKKSYSAGIQITEKDIFLCVTRGNNVSQVRCHHQEYFDEKSFLSALMNIQKNIPRRSKIILGLSKFQLIEKELSLDGSLNNEEILLYIKQHAKHFFGYDYQQLYIDFFSLYEKNEGEQTVLIISCIRTIIDKICRLMKKAGIKISIIDSNAYAILRVIRSQFKNSYNTFAILHFYADEVFFRIYQNNCLVFESYDNKNNAMELWKEYFDSTKIISFDCIYLIGEKLLIQKTKTELNEITNIKIYEIVSLRLLKSRDFITAFGLSLWRKHGI